MSGPENVEHPAEPVPPAWQAGRLATLLDALDGVPLSAGEHRTLTWLCGFEAHTVEHLVAILDRAGSVATRKQAARDQLETGRLRRELSETHDEMDDLDDRYRGQLLNLCHWAGIDPGQDPHAVLLAHLRGRGPGGGRSS